MLREGAFLEYQELVSEGQLLSVPLETPQVVSVGRSTGLVQDADQVVRVVVATPGLKL